MNYTYKTKGVCSRQINLEISDDGVINRVEFIGGCNGNTKGVAALCVGQKAEEVISRLEGIKCGSKSTSCPEQLAFALKEALAQ
ncbi:MAG TPA: TIGR03905 family TSCPD domain-containing protein [Firmicutes bacterium]|nr:TIGR03905 family TSCPD domain-containing protein [Bacillota bacterium]